MSGPAENRRSTGPVSPDRSVARTYDAFHIHRAHEGALVLPPPPDFHVRVAHSIPVRELTA